MALTLHVLPDIPWAFRIRYCDDMADSPAPGIVSSRVFMDTFSTDPAAHIVSLRDGFGGYPRL